MTACITADINGLAFDGVTPDANGACYSWQEIAGWFDSSDLSIITDQKPIGVSEVGIAAGGRSITFTGIIHMPSADAPLDTIAWAAMRHVKLFCGCTFRSVLLKVNEPSLGLQSYVRQSAPIRFKPQGTDGLGIANVSFQVPLLAPDPRRYAQTLTTLALPAGTTTVTNNGDFVTPPIATFTSGTNPYIQNTSVAGSPFVRFNGTVSGSLVIDMGLLRATMGGVDVSSALSGGGSGPPNWWQLLPGGNSIIVSGASCSLAYRDAYS